MSAALDQLERSHRRHDEEMARLCESAERLAEGAPLPDDLEVIADALAFLERSSPRHFADEEQSLFPRLKERDPSLAPELDRIAAEHRDHEARHAALRALFEAGDAQGLSEAADGLEVVYRRHVSDEDNLFARARTLLTPEDDFAIVAEMDGRRGRGGGGGGGGRRRL